MNYTNVLVGPHLIGLIFIVIGLLQKYLPPKSINRWYGYRTPNARTNQQTWDEANRYSANFMIKAGLFALVIGFVIYSGMLYFNVDYNVQKTVNYTILFGGAMGIGILSTVVTERHLKLTFKKLNFKKRK
jgi:uncharacterized membrane protein